MLVLTFAVAGAGNCVELEGMPYVFARTRVASLVMPVKCAHRGGPLHLAEFIGSDTRLTCPWHGRRVSVTRLLAQSPPAVRRGNTVTAVFRVPAGTRHTIRHLPLSAALSAPRPRPGGAGSGR